MGVVEDRRQWLRNCIGGEETGRVDVKVAQSRRRK